MGARGTDVAREAAALVSPTTTSRPSWAAVRHGRRHLRQPAQGDGVHDGGARAHRRASRSSPCCFGWPLVLLPVHIVFLELIIDPACSIAFEAEPGDPDAHAPPPATASGRLFDRRLVTWPCCRGSRLLAAAMVCLPPRAAITPARSDAGSDAGVRDAHRRETSALILVNRSWRRSVLATLARRNVASWAVVAGATLPCSGSPSSLRPPGRSSGSGRRADTTWGWPCPRDSPRCGGSTS